MRQVSGFKDHVFQAQADAVLNQANPVSGTQYTVLATANNVRIISIAARCTWTVQPDPLEVYLTIDGKTMTFTQVNPISLSYYEPRIRADLADTALDMAAAASNVTRSFLIEGRSVSITAEVTGGTVSNLSARVKYEMIP